MVEDFPPAGRIEYRAGWLDGGRADALFKKLHDEVAWQARSIRIFGREVMQPRLVAFQGDLGVAYRYSGVRWQADAWHTAIFELLAPLKAVTGVRFNSVLCNLYRDGHDAIGWHADDEPELGIDPVIAAVSLGAPRRFVLRYRKLPARKREITPGHGSLLVMRGDLQHNWQHQVPRMRRVNAARINLTFRLVR